MAVALLTKETCGVLFFAMVVWLVARIALGGGRKPKVALALLLAGVGLGLVPMVARNLAVGASPLQLSCVPVFNFYGANAADHPSQGVLPQVPPSMRQALHDTGGDAWGMVKKTFTTYAGHSWGFVANLGAKFQAMFSNVEVSDNFSHEYQSEHSSLLAGLLRFRSILIVGLAGWVLLARAFWLRHRRREEDASKDVVWEWLALVALALAAHIAAQTFVVTIGRYRLALVPFFILPAAWFIVQLWESVRTKDRAAARRIAGCLAGVWLAWAIWPENPVLVQAARRTVDYHVGAEILVKRGDLAGARKQFERMLPVLRDRLPPAERGLAEFNMRWSRLGFFSRWNHLDEVRDDWDIVSRAAPNDRLVRALRPRFEPGAGTPSVGGQSRPN
jgi:hypothetical protein